MSKPRFVTLGCRLNTHESHVMQDLAEKAGLPNAIIVNTCAVTAEAERQARQTIRRLRKDNPDAYLIATGCAVQLRPSAFSDMPELDRIIGNDHKLKAESFAKDFPHRALVSSFEKTPTNQEFPLLKNFEGRSRAFLQIQNGCDHRCAFCNISIARGPSRSVPLGLIVQQIHYLLEAGVQEVIFTGVDLTSYGKGLPGDLTLGKMVKRVLMQVPELKRLRLSSLDSIEIDQDLYTLLSTQERLLPHLHLSFQSGDNTILKRMRRRHMREDSIIFCQSLLKDRPDFVLGADFITGFPGEEEDMFQRTVDLVQECHLTHLHVFPFSSRPGTLAARMDGHLPKEIVKRRAKDLREIGNQQLQKHLEKYRGQQCTVLLEENAAGHTDDFTKVMVPHCSLSNQTIQVVVRDIGTKHLIGEIIENI